MRMRLLLAGFALAGMTVLSGCDTVGGWFGEADDPPLPGERVAVLMGERGLQADAGAAAERVGLPAAYRNANWPQPGGDSAHAFRHLELSSSPRIAWRASVGEGSSSNRRLLAQPVVRDGRVFTLDARRQVSAFDLSSGRRAWSQNLGSERSSREEYFGGGVSSGDGRVYVTTGFGSLFALNAGSGEILWEASLGAPLRAGPTFSDGRVYASTTENVIHAVDAETGERLWNHTGLEEIASLLGGASPAVAGDTVVAAFSSGEIVALLTDNGRVLWEDSLAGVRRLEQSANIAQVRGHPVMDEGLVVAVSNSDLMLAVDQRSGMPVWEASIGSTQTPWVSGNSVFLVTNDAQLVALRRNDGSVRWVQQLERYADPEDRTDPIVWSGPVLAGGRLVLTNNRGHLVFASPEDGTVQASQSLPGPVTIQPVVADGTLLLLTDAGQLLALR